MSDGSLPGTPLPGLLIAIGGAEDKVKERAILRSFVAAAGGPDAHLVVLATASEVPETGERYADLFYDLNVEEVDVLRISTREEALTAGPEVVDILEYATGLFMTGGSQLRLSSALGGTLMADAIRRRHRTGMVVAGTSAGASFLSEHMIALGESGATPRRRQVQLVQGLGLARNLILDQHFRRRDRLGRLLAALSANPGSLGAGVDEDTAALIDGHGVLTVLGAGAVTVVDATGMHYTDPAAADQGGPIAMLGVRVDVLTAGCRYDLNARRGLAPVVQHEPVLNDAEDLEKPAF